MKSVTLKSIARNRLVGLVFGVAAGAAAFTLSRVPLISVCVFIVAGSLAFTVAQARQDAREVTDGESVPQIVDSISTSIASGVSLIEALDNLVAEGQPSIRVKAERLLAIFESDSSLEEKVARSKPVLNSREGDLFLELVLIASRRGDDAFTDALTELADALRSQQSLNRELVARQGWVMATARLGLASPWVVLLLLSVRPESATAFQSQLGAGVLLTGLALSFAAQRLIVAGARVPRVVRQFSQHEGARV
jgi:tight adherence protein B